MLPGVVALEAPLTLRLRPTHDGRVLQLGVHLVVSAVNLGHRLAFGRRSERHGLRDAAAQLSGIPLGLGQLLVTPRLAELDPGREVRQEPSSVLTA